MADRAQLFADIDTMDPDRFAAHLADDVAFSFGNGDPVRGRDAVRDVWAGFCQGVKGVSHEPVDRWEGDHGTVAEARVTYTRPDDSTVTVPVVTIYREGEDGIADYRVYIDLAPLFS